jgi:hypothetical protein
VFKALESKKGGEYLAKIQIYWKNVDRSCILNTLNITDNSETQAADIDDFDKYFEKTKHNKRKRVLLGLV